MALVNEGEASGACADRACAGGARADGACVDGACVDGACVGGACVDEACDIIYGKSPSVPSGNGGFVYIKGPIPCIDSVLRDVARARDQRTSTSSRRVENR